MSLLDSAQLSELKVVLGQLTETSAKECRLSYQPIMVDCEACASISDIGNKPNNTWLHGGPFLCSNCNGTRKKPQSVTENVKLVIDWSPKEARLLGATVEMPFGVIKCRGYLYDLPKVSKALEIEVDLPSSPYVKAVYKMSDFPIDAGAVMKGSYFLAILSRLR